MIAVYILIAAAAAGLDQLFKALVVEHVKPAGKVTFIPHILDLVYSENRGVAFSMFQDGRWFFIIVTSAVIVVFSILLFRHRKGSRLFGVACALIIGGGIGNLIDRIFLGYVVDFLSLSFFPPICNFADYCITAGTVLLIVYLLFFSDMMKKKETGQPADETKISD